MGEVVLRTTELTKSYGKVPAVDHVSLTIEKGDIYGFIGENGAGKSTFMRMVCGLAFPSSGVMELFGENSVKGLETARRRMGAIIEHPALYGNMTAMENLTVQRKYLNLEMGEAGKKENQELLELVGLGDTGKKKAGKFSLGMRQRLGLALALLGEPEFLVLDEPMIGLDPIGVMELRALLQKLNRERKITILFSSHNLSEMTLIATRYGFLHKGRLLEESDADTVRAQCESRGIRLESYFVELLQKASSASAMPKEVQ